MLDLRAADVSRGQRRSADDVYVDRTIASRAGIPDDPRPGNYVVIDVTHFSTTVVELLHAGAECVYVPEERGLEHEFVERNPEARIGGGSGPDYTAPEGYDFFNSPSSVRSVDVAGRPTALTSSNGGAAVTDLRTRGGPDVDVYVASLSNARRVAAFLDALDDDRPVITVAAGSNGKPSPEDTVGGVLVQRYLAGDDPTEAELDLYREVVTAGKAAKYSRKAAIRYRDLLEFATAVDTRTAVPKLDGQRLVDVSDEESDG